MRFIGKDPNIIDAYYTATAEGAITAGKPVIVEADGDVTQISATGGGSSAGTAFEASYVFQYGPGAVYDSTNDRVVIVGGDSSGRFEARVGTVSGETISFGSGQTVGDDPLVEDVCAIYDPDNSKVIVAYRDRSNSNYGTCRVGTVSGSTISFGTATVFLSAAGSDKQITYDTNANKVVIASRNNSDSGNGYGFVGTVSGTNISFGSGTAFNSTGTTDNIGVCFDNSNNKVVVAYQDNAAGLGIAAVGTVSGTSISFGTPVTFAARTAMANCVFDSTNNKVVIFYKDQDNSNYGTAIVGTVSGTSISFGSEVVFESSSVNMGNNKQASVFDPDNSLACVNYTVSGTGGCMKAGTVSDTSISFGDRLNFESGDSYEFGVVYDTTSDRLISNFYDNGRSNYFTSVVIKTASTNLTSENYIEIADDTYADNADATVAIVGCIDRNQTGLTAGQQYYVQTDGTLSTTPDTPSVLAGTAISATELVVKE